MDKIMSIKTSGSAIIKLREITDTENEHDYAALNRIGETVGFYDAIVPQLAECRIYRRAHVDAAYALPNLIIIFNGELIY